MFRSLRSLVSSRLLRNTRVAAKHIQCIDKRQYATRGRPKVVEMKRKDPPSKEKPTAKKPRPEVPEYHATPSIKEEDGTIQWPAPKHEMEKAREIILEW
jgi:hypothetical protein